MTQTKVIEAIQRMRKVRKLARMYPVATLPKRLAALAQVALGEDEPSPERSPKRSSTSRQSRTGSDRMERGGVNRGDSGDS